MRCASDSITIRVSSSANERVGSQQAVLGQQMSAYYPTISMSNSLSHQPEQHQRGNDHAADAFTSQAIANMTLYNFGKREGNVQAARETLDATKKRTTRRPTKISCYDQQAYYVY